MKGTGDWCPLNALDPLYHDAILLTADPGDLILWDSRTIHGGRVGTGKKSVDCNKHVNATDKVNCMPGFVRKTVRIKRAENVRIL